MNDELTRDKIVKFMKYKYRLITFCIISIFLLPCNAFSERGIIRKQNDNENRHALVIGNGAYKSLPLKNPVNDARDFAGSLNQLGFDVILEENADRRTMANAIRKFGNRLSRYGGTALFYFSGHGMQMNGSNYLIPVDAIIESELDVKYESVEAGMILGRMEDARNGLNIVILDTSRNNPFARKFRTMQQGLARMDAPKGTIIVYATTPGAVAADGNGRNGIFTKHLLRHIKTPGMSVEQILKIVRIGVIRETNNRQIPWVSSSLSGTFYLAGSSATAILPPPINPDVVKPEYSDLTIRVNGLANANIYFDGIKMGKAPMKITNIMSGNHEIRVSADGYKDKKMLLSFDYGESQNINLILNKIEAEQNKYPQFSWPPPHASSIIEIPRNFLINNNQKIHNLEYIESKICNALDRCGYFERSYYAIPDGFALVTRLEQINEDGTPKDKTIRWSTEVEPVETFSIDSYIKALFLASPGYYRIIVFTITPHHFSQSDKTISRKEAMSWVQKGSNKLPEFISKNSYSESYSCTALVYEFEQKQSWEKAKIKLPGRLTGIEHLKKAKLWAVLER